MITFFNLLKFSRRKKKQTGTAKRAMCISSTTPLKMNGWNLKITQLKKENIFQTSLLGLKMLIFQGVIMLTWKSHPNILFLLCKHVEIISETAGDAGVMFISNKDYQGHSASWINWPELPLAQLFFGNKASFCTRGHPTSWWKQGCFISEWSV